MIKPLPKNEARTRASQIGVRFTPNEKNAIVKWAAAEERIMSDVIRRCVLKAVRAEGFLK
ncbi:MAG: hypothetical protein ACLP4V_22255 [Methylocella sp.]